MPLHLGEVGLRLSGLESLSPLLDSRPSKRSPEGTMTDPIGTGPLRHQLERRRFMGVLTASFLAAPLVAGAQQERKVSRVGILASGLATEALYAAFFDRMRALGYVEGRTVTFERRFAEGRIQDLPTLAEQLVTTKPDVIFAPHTNAALAARKATQIIPIVFAVSADPIGAGLVAS